MRKINHQSSQKPTVETLVIMHTHVSVYIHNVCVCLRMYKMHNTIFRLIFAPIVFSVEKQCIRCPVRVTTRVIGGFFSNCHPVDISTFSSVIISIRRPPRLQITTKNQQHVRG